MTNAEKLPRKLKAAAETSETEAREQADQYESLFGNVDLVLDNGDVVKIPPPPDYGLLDDERMAAYEALIFEVDTEYEREPDVFIPEQKMDNGLVLPAETQRGALKRPYRKVVDGKPVLVTPPHTVRVVMAALGDDEYARLKAGGKQAGDVWKIWTDLSLKIRERQQRDSKSNGGSVAVASVPEPDSQ